MSDPYLGEIRIFAGSYAPENWSLCNGQLLPISGNEALFTLLSTIYGGDGVNTFALPNLQGRIPINQGAGPALTPRALAAIGGTAEVTLTTPQLPAHSHSLFASTNAPSVSSPAGAVFANPGSAYNTYRPIAGAANIVVLPPSQTITNEGGSQPHANLMPTTGLNYIIATVGIYPQQN